MLFHGTPTMHLWMPCYAWTRDADPQRVSEGLLHHLRVLETLTIAPADPLVPVNPHPIPTPGFHTGRRPPLDKDCFQLVIKK